MAANRLTRILAELSVDHGAMPSSGRLCDVSAQIIGVTGAGVMLMSDDLPRGSLSSADEVSNLIEELQYTLGQGPCIDAYQQARVVVEPDLAEPDNPRWLAFRDPALAAGVRAIFGFPLRVGAVRFGALNLYRTSRGHLTADQHADALVMADVIVRWLLDVLAAAPPDTMAAELESGADFHFVVHQAAGMISVQLGITLAEALVRLRAHAFSHGLLVTDVSKDVVARQLRVA